MGTTGHTAQDRAEDGVQTLCFPEQFTLWAMRVWVRGCLDGRPVGHLLNPAFEKLHAQDGPGLLRQFMTVLARGATRRMATNCPCAAQVTADERRLLDLIGALQRDALRSGAADLSDLVRPEWQEAVTFSASLLGACLERCGLELPVAVPLRHEARPHVLH